MNVGIDKLTLYSKEYKLHTDNDFIHTETIHNGKLVGRKAYFNQPGIVSIDIDQRGARLMFNPSKLTASIANQPPNYLIETSNQLNDSIDIVLTAAEAAGMTIPNAGSISISRIDLAKDRQTDYPAADYFPAMLCLGGRRMKQRNEPTSMYIGNGQRQACFYDKAIQINDDTKGDISIAPNTSRFECRSLKTREVQKNIQLNTLNDLRNYTADRWQHDYHTSLKNEYFQLKKDNAADFPKLSTLINTMTTDEILLQIMQQTKLEAATNQHMHNIINYFGGIRKLEVLIAKKAHFVFFNRDKELMKKILLQSGQHRSSVHRKVNQAAAAYKELLIVDKLANQHKIDTMLNELIVKFTKAA